MSTQEQRQRIAEAANAYANPKTKVIQSYDRLCQAFEAGAKWALELRSAFEKLEEAQERIPPDIQKVVNENFWDMIGDDEKYPNPLS